MAESDRRPGESERDWMRRVAALGRRAEQARKDQARQDSADAAAEEQAIREAMGDEVWLADATETLFGLTPDQLQNQIDRAKGSKSWDRRDQEIVDALGKERKQRFLESKRARNKRVARFMKKNKGKINRAAKKGKRGWFW